MSRAPPGTDLRAACPKPVPPAGVYCRDMRAALLVVVLCAAPSIAAAQPAPASQGAKLPARAYADLVRAFPADGAPAEAFATFESAAPGRGLELLEQLAELELDRADAFGATEVYEDLLGRAPDDPRR